MQEFIHTGWVPRECEYSTPENGSPPQKKHNYDFIDNGFYDFDEFSAI
jgi:hypothetical protein